MRTFLNFKQGNKCNVIGKALLCPIVLNPSCIFRFPESVQIPGHVWYFITSSLFDVRICYNLCFSPRIIRIMKSTRMRLEGHIGLMREDMYAHRILVEKSEGF